MKQIFLLLSILLLLSTVCACGDLFYYSKHGMISGVAPYVEKGEIERTNQYGFTPLMIATYYGHTHLVKYLVENGADVNRQDNNGWTALRYAYHYNYKEIAEILLKYNATVYPAKEKPSKPKNNVTVSTVKVNPNEPWTGEWKVEGSSVGGIWIFKQSGKEVVTTAGSSIDLIGRVEGNKLKGRRKVIGTPFAVKISPDYMSFEGYVKGQPTAYFVKGKKLPTQPLSE
jgi:hypothetical protein